MLICYCTDGPSLRVVYTMFGFLHLNFEIKFISTFILHSFTDSIRVWVISEQYDNFKNVLLSQLIAFAITAML